MGSPLGRVWVLSYVVEVNKILNSATLMNVQRGINDEDIAEIILGQNLQSGGAPAWRGGVYRTHRSCSPNSRKIGLETIFW